MLFGSSVVLAYLVNRLNELSRSAIKTVKWFELEAVLKQSGNLIKYDEDESELLRLNLKTLLDNQDFWEAVNHNDHSIRWSLKRLVDQPVPVRTAEVPKVPSLHIH